MWVAPTPGLDQLGADLSARYGWLADLDDDEQTLAQGRPQDRNVVLRLLGDLPGSRLNGAR